jgi:small subunit ribosomal protein S1
VVSIGDTVRIKVLAIDRDRQRISLGLKQTQEDPWQRVISTHRPGDVLEGTVTKVVAFGAFVEILPGVEGLVHISELADHHVESPSEVVEPGTKLNVKILEIDEERRRLSLSIKRVEGQNMPMQNLGEQVQAAEASEQQSAQDESGAAEVEQEAATDEGEQATEEDSSAGDAEPAAEAEPAGEDNGDSAEDEATGAEESEGDEEQPGGDEEQPGDDEEPGDSEQAGDSGQD